MENIYQGSCHCGAVRFEVTMAPPEKIFSGNCSICKRMGWLLTFAPMESFKLLSGQEQLTDYQFGNQKIHHVFCKVCGIRSFSRGVSPAGHGEVAALNVRCLENIDLSNVPVHSYDCATL